ncbi:hypothetical protein AKG34_21390, partial [Peribacillus butanolivorans]|uniref:hypothetical protein n=1 Tax=Peribacillus butanolivorans TaxID=421767 RepID=UPI0006C0993A
MRKKNLLVILIFFISFISIVPISTVSAAVEKTDITSSQYGTQFRDTLTFDVDTCKKDYKKLHKKIKNSKDEQELIDEEYAEQISSGGNPGRLTVLVNPIITGLGNAMSNMITSTACTLGFAPSQLLQLMFFPIVLDNFGFLDELSTTVQTISIVTLVVITVMAILELNNRQGSITEEVVSKTGSFLLATGIIAFSMFALQGIYDIANILSYYVSNYEVNILVDPGKGIEVFEGKETGASLDVNLLNYPMIFVSYLEFALKPEFLNTLPGYSLMMESVLNLVKILVLFFKRLT